MMVSTNSLTSSLIGTSVVEVGGAVDELGVGVAVARADERRTEPWNEPLRYERVHVRIVR